LKFPGNISYLLKQKKNHLLPEIFNDYLLNIDLAPYTVIEGKDYRLKMLASADKICMTDFGAGSRKMKNNQRNVSDVAKISGTIPEFGMFYQKLIQYYNLTDILEMGTSVGIGTVYFSTASKSTYVTGIEACPQTYLFLKENLTAEGISNVNLINKDFDSVFAEGTLGERKFDFVFIDGNHIGESLLKYYEILQMKYLQPKYVIIIDDINWTLDMYKAWKIICGMDNTKTYLNFYRFGVVFSGFELPVGNFPINFVNHQTI
jgi:predicted O-methyltransferase YrrM